MHYWANIVRRVYNFLFIREFGVSNLSLKNRPSLPVTISGLILMLILISIYFQDFSTSVLALVLILVPVSVCDFAFQY